MKIKPEHYFFTKDNQTLTSKDDLLRFLKETSDHLFHEHVNAQRNDFASWTVDILKDKKLSKKMTKCHNRSEMVRILEESMKVKRGVHTDKHKKSVISQLVDAIKHG